MDENSLLNCSLNHSGRTSPCTPTLGTAETMTLPFGVPLPCPTFPCGALESGYVVFEFLACHLRVKLRGGDIGIPQNLAHAFYRHTVIQCQNSE